MDTAALTEQRYQAPLTGSSSDTTPALASGLVPLVVGITGHRDLRDVDHEPLERAVRELFTDLRAHNPGRPLALMTSLAEGADTLVARIALDFAAQLVVVLPVPRHEYERDFQGSAHAVFVRLLDDPRVVRRVAIPTIERKSKRFDEETWRALQYALAGAYIAHHSDVLLALWDGRPSDRIGGTAQVVHYRRAGAFDVDAATAACLADVPEPFGLHYDLLEPSGGGPVVQIVAPRRDGLEPDGAFGRVLLPPYFPAPSPDSGEEEERYTDALAETDARIAELNAEASALEHRDPETVDAVAAQLHPDAGAPPELASLRRSFALADVLAVHYQRVLNRVLILLFALIFVAGVAFAFVTHQYAEWLTAPVPLMGVYIGLLAAADAIFIRVRLRGWQDRYQDYRAIAEGLRAQFYWRLAGLDDAASDHYVRRQRDELAWIPRVVRACSVVAPPATTDRLNDVHAFWAKTQAEYYENARARAQRKLRWRHAGSGALAASLAIGLCVLWSATASILFHGTIVTAGLVLLAHARIELQELSRTEQTRDGDSGYWDPLAQIGGFVAALGAMAVLVNVPRWFPAHPEWMPQRPGQWMLLSLGVTALAGALLHAYSRLRAFGEHARRYARLAAIFDRAADRIRAALEAGEQHRARAIIVELGQESLTDHGEWVMLHRERPIELPETNG